MRKPWSVSLLLSVTLLSLSAPMSGQVTISLAQVGYNGSPTNLCNHEQTHNGPTQALCTGSIQTDRSSGAGTSTASASYEQLQIGTNVAVVNNTGQLEMQVHAEAQIEDFFSFSNLNQSAFLQVVSAMFANPIGGFNNSVLLQVDMNNGNGKTAECVQQTYGQVFCPVRVPLDTNNNFGHQAQMTVLLAGEADINCGPECQGGQAGMGASYLGSQSPIGSTVFAVIVTDANGDPLKDVTITSASGHVYPSIFPSVVTLTSFPNPSMQGQIVTFTATVTSPGRVSSPTGAVTFRDETTSTDLGTVFLDNRGIGQLVASFFGPGTRLIRASYSGDQYSAPSLSNELFQIVQ